MNEATTETTIQTLAAEASSYFTAGERLGEDDRPIRILKDSRPEWVFELVHEAHGEMMPDDWRYSCIEDALDWIADCDDPDDGRGEFADASVDVYTGARLAWLGSNGYRADYCDEAVRQFGMESADITERIGLGQYYEADEVFGLVLQALESRLDELETDED